MRILVYGMNYAPELISTGKFTGEMCEWLAEQGHEVRVVCSPPYYPAWKVEAGYSAFSYTQEERNGVKVLRCPLWIPSRPSGLHRILNLASFAMSSLPVALITALTWRPQIVLVLEPTFFCAPAAVISARIAGARAWLHIQDLELDAAFALGLIRSRLLQRIACRVEQFVMERFDRVSTISHSMLSCINGKGLFKNPVVLFPNWIDSNLIYPKQSSSPLREEWGIAPDSIVVLYSGNMGEKQGLELVVEAARILRHEGDILFILSGDGSARYRLEQVSTGLGNIRFTPLQPLNRLNDLLNLADIHILPQRPDVDSLVMPSKLLGMLASGRPVIASATVDSELASTIQNCGLVVPPGDAGALAESILSLSNNAAQRMQLGASARDLCKKRWDKDGVLRNFEKLLIQ